MDVMKRRILIPRKRTSPVPFRVEDLDQRVQLPLEEVLVKVIARLYRKGRPSNEPA